MNFNQHDIQHESTSRTIAAQARHLMSAKRQRVHHRAQAMLSRASVEIGLDS